MNNRILFSIISTLILLGCENPESNEITSELSMDNETIVSDKDREIITIHSKSLGTLSYERVDDQNILEGDIILTDQQVNIFKNEDVEDNTSKSAPGAIVGLWPNSEVNYWIEIPEKINDINWVISYLQDKTNLKFTERRSGNYIAFVSGNGCSSKLGMIGGQQNIVLASGCSRGNILHEVLHALGIVHEQSRPDRDQYININYHNMVPGFERQFESRFALNYGRFDLSSIMMYSPCAFAIACGNSSCDDCTASEATITRKDGSLYTINRSFLSYIDRNVLLDMYPKDVRKLSIATLDIGANESGDVGYLIKNGRYINAYKKYQIGKAF